MITERRHLLLAGPLLPVALAAGPARAATTDLVLNCDTTLGPALRAASRRFAARHGVDVRVFPTPPGLLLPQLVRTIQNDLVVTTRAVIEEAVKSGLIAAEAPRGAWRNRFLLAARTGAGQAALKARVAVPDATPASDIDGPAVLRKLGLAPERVLGVIDTDEVAWLLARGAADAGLLHATDLHAHPDLVALRDVPDDTAPGAALCGRHHHARAPSRSGGLQPLPHGRGRRAHGRERLGGGRMSHRGVQTHAAAVRVGHWLLAFAMLVMIGSGWRIYNASPIFGFRFPVWATLGGDVETSLAWHGDPGVATAIAWHLAGMWLLFVAFLILLAWGVLSGHFYRDFLPLTPRRLARDAIDAVTFRLAHRLGEYNAVQKFLYWCVLIGVAVMIASGLAIWKPVQTWPLELLFGGFQGARLVHFLVMSGLVLFLVVHLALVALFPGTLVAMVIGRHGGAAPMRQEDRA